MSIESICPSNEPNAAPSTAKNQAPSRETRHFQLTRCHPSRKQSSKHETISNHPEFRHLRQIPGTPLCSKGISKQTIQHFQGDLRVTPEKTELSAGSCKKEPRVAGAGGLGTCFTVWPKLHQVQAKAPDHNFISSKHKMFGSKIVGMSH